MRALVFIFLVFTLQLAFSQTVSKISSIDILFNVTPMCGENISFTYKNDTKVSITMVPNQKMEDFFSVRIFGGSVDWNITLESNLSVLSINQTQYILSPEVNYSLPFKISIPENATFEYKGNVTLFWNCYDNETHNGSKIIEFTIKVVNITSPGGGVGVPNILCIQSYDTRGYKLPQVYIKLNSSEYETSGTSDDTGHICFQMPYGEYLVYGSKEGYYPNQTLIKFQKPMNFSLYLKPLEGTPPPTIEKRGDICFLVLNQKNQTLSGVSIKLANLQRGTGQNGTACFYGIPFGEYSYQVYHPLYYEKVGSFNFSSYLRWFIVKLSPIPPHLEVIPDKAEFTSYVNTTVQPKMLTIRNKGGLPVKDVYINHSKDWLLIQYEFIPYLEGGKEMEIAIVPKALPNPGNYSDTIIFNASEGGIVYVNIFYNVLAKPQEKTKIDYRVYVIGGAVAFTLLFLWAIFAFVAGKSI